MPSETSKLLSRLKTVIPEEVPELDDESYDEMIALFHEVFGSLKNIAFDKSNWVAREDFEEGWGALSIQYAMDCIPEIHRILLKHYKRSDELRFLDVGAGTAAGTSLFTMLHSGRHVYSKMSVEAIDYRDSRRRWVKTMYPRVNYRVIDVFDLPGEQWDIVFCSHVIEHVPEPRSFLEQLIRVCKGFLFVYSPYNETDRIMGHLNTITEELYDGLNIENLTIMKSMAWHAAIAEDMCLLVVIDCRT